MARALTAYLNRKDVPARNALQHAVDQLGFNLKLDESYAPGTTAAYLPCTLDGEDAGFDIRFHEIGADVSSVVKSAIEARDQAISFRWASDPREELAALAVCAALVKQFGAVVHEPDKDQLLPFDQLIAMAKGAQASL
jgi:hypothetical protein